MPSDRADGIVTSVVVICLFLDAVLRGVVHTITRQMRIKARASIYKNSHRDYLNFVAKDYDGKNWIRFQDFGCPDHSAEYDVKNHTVILNIYHSPNRQLRELLYRLSQHDFVLYIARRRLLGTLLTNRPLKVRTSIEKVIYCKWLKKRLETAHLAENPDDERAMLIETIRNRIGALKRLQNSGIEFSVTIAYGMHRLGVNFRKR